jgi:hypothetical protein
MLRRLFEGLGMLLLVAVVFSRLDAGFMLPGLAVAGGIGFTAWRIRNLWRRYQVHMMTPHASANRNAAVENEMLALRGQQHGRGAELTFWTGFVLGGAMVADAPSATAGEDGAASFGGMEGGGFSGDL